MKRLLASLLVISLAINGYLWLQLHKTDNPPVAPSRHTAPATPTPGPAITLQPQQQQTAIADKKALRTWLKQGNYEALQQALTDALKTAPLDPELLLLEAELILHTEPLSEAILHYYSLLDLPLAAQHHRDIEAQISELVSNAVRQLKQSGSWSLLAEFMEPLFQRMPLEQKYARWLAQAYAQQQKPTLTEDVLAALPAGDPAIERIRAMLAATATATPQADEAPSQQAPTDDITIALAREHDQYFAHVQFGNLPARLLLDTGASTTAITQSLYASLKRRQALPFIGNFTVNTAGGRIRAPMFEIPLMTFGPLRFEQTPVLVLPPAVLPAADGLLGMNILRGYHFAIDQQQATLTLSSQRRKTNR